jgi:hypothetical protein
MRLLVDEDTASATLITRLLADGLTRLNDFLPQP